MPTYKLTLAQKTLIQKARNVGNSEMAVPLSAEVCVYLCGVVVKDINLVSNVPEVPEDLPAFFETWPVSSLTLVGIPFEDLAAKVFAVRWPSGSLPPTPFVKPNSCIRNSSRQQKRGSPGSQQDRKLYVQNN